MFRIVYSVLLVSLCFCFSTISVILSAQGTIKLFNRIDFLYSEHSQFSRCFTCFVSLVQTDGSKFDYWLYTYTNRSYKLWFDGLVTVGELALSRMLKDLAGLKHVGGVAQQKSYNYFHLLSKWGGLAPPTNTGASMQNKHICLVELELGNRWQSEESGLSETRRLFRHLGKRIGVLFFVGK